MAKIDRRRHYIMVLDTETCNTFRDAKGNLNTSNALVYDIGWAVVDKHGNVYETASYINFDVFYGESELMKSAYYANKIETYIADIDAGTRIVANTYTIRKALVDTLEKYDIKEVACHNARFDKDVLNSTIRWETKSKYRTFFPRYIEIWDTMKMARDVILKMPTYRRFCEENDLLTKTGRLSASAECLYKFIINDVDFEESHTGLEDVMIEKDILAYCFRQHKAMRKRLYDKPFTEPYKDPFQWVKHLY